MSEHPVMAGNAVEVSRKGQWVSVPAAEVCGHTVTVSGRLFRIASIQDEFWTEGELQDPEAFLKGLKECRSNGFKADIFTFSQKLPNTSPRHPYRMEWDNIAAIPLGSYESWWAKLPAETRRNVRLSAKRGVSTKVCELDGGLIRGIMAVNNESPIRQGKRFHHYGKDFETVRKDYATFAGRSVFVGAFVQDELVAFMKIVYVGKVAAIMQLLSKMAHYDKKPANALIAKAVEHCTREGATHLTYIKYRYGKKRESPLTEFKRRNGFEEVLIPQFYVPLTARGRVALALRLHRPLVELLPERLMYALLRLRTGWYERNLKKRRTGSTKESRD